MKLLITGVNGQLGHDILLQAAQRGFDAHGVDVQEMDITNPAAVQSVLENGHYDAVIHCAAWTAVDKAEEPEFYPMVEAVNAAGTGNISYWCERLGIPMMYFSTDYVFDGEGETPWQEDDPRSPLNVYGLTKSMGEDYVRANPRHFIVRISWVFGENGSNFVKTMLRLAKTRDRLTVVNDQIGLPTYTKDLARLALDMIETEQYGTYHATNTGDYISWYDFAKEIFRQSHQDVQVVPVDSSQFAAKAKRPHNSRMSQTKLTQNGFIPLRPWQEALADYITILNQAS